MNTSRRPVVTVTLSGLAALSCLLLAPPGAEAATACSVTAGASDFNGDGYDDAAVGDPNATVDGVERAGAVTVLLGDADGRIGEGSARTVLTRRSFGETPRAGDRFGFDVALAVTGHRGRCADLLVGTPGADVGPATDAGLVHLVSDLPDVEGTPQVEAIPLTQADVRGTPETGDTFGSAVAITSVNQEGRTRLVVGAPGEDIGSAADAGSVGVFEVDAEPIGLAELRQGRRGPLGAVRLPDTPQPGDRFGSSLAVGRLDLSETSGDDVASALVIGAPGDTVAGRDNAGSVTVLQEKFESAVLLSQATKGVGGTPEAGDGFGTSVALNPLIGPAGATLAVGSPGEDAGRTADTGTVTVFGNRGERLVPGQVVSQATSGVPGATEAGDRFGAALAFGHHDTTLLIGVPGEDVGRIGDAGSVQPVTLTGSGILRFRPALTENAPGTWGSIGTGNRFGEVLGSLHGTTEDVLTVASPFARRGSVYVLSDADDVAARSWVPAVAGAQRFGWSVSN